MAASKATPTASRALVVPLTGCVSLWGCTTTVHDLAVEGVSVTDSAEWFPWAVGLSEKEQTNRILLRVDLTTEVDLSQAFSRWDMLIHANVVFCSHPNDSALLGHSLYTTTPRFDELPRPLNGSRSVESSDTRERTYYLPLNVAMPPTLTIKRGGVSFDLLDNPEDICISLHGASMPLTTKWHYVRSNTVRLSSDTIRKALSDTHPTDRPSNNRWRGL
jgi:hypothetical protein